MGAWGEAPDPLASRVQGQRGGKPSEADEVVIPGKKLTFRLKVATSEIETHFSIIGLIHETNRQT